ncbi:GNAT family N-acetyltransferase [Neobacillus sp. K501]
MLNFEIRRPQIEDKIALNVFFRAVIIDTFTREGIGEKLDDIEAEINIKNHYLETDFASNGEKRYFLIALTDEQIIGSIEYGPASELINTCTNNALMELPEIGTVFVHPDFQKKGVGNQLLKAMYARLQNIGMGEFCLDSGYPRAQTIWKKKFGEPDYLLKDYWGEGFDHMIWSVRFNGIKK